MAGMKAILYSCMFLVSIQFLSAQTPADSVKPLIYVEKMPLFPGGKEKLIEYLNANLRYPEDALIKKTSGVVIVRFVVSPEGKISNARVIRGLGSGCDEEALRLVSTFPPWIPGEFNGRPVPVEFTLPIKFSL
jgi:protein TonB